jgi:hypothetical protein
MNSNLGHYHEKIDGKWYEVWDTDNESGKSGKKEVEGDAAFYLECGYHVRLEARTKIEGWDKNTKDRIDYNPDGETIDEVVMVGANVHLEQLDDSCFMLIVENEKHMWHLNICSRSGRPKVDAKLYESEDKK